MRCLSWNLFGVSLSSNPASKSNTNRQLTPHTKFSQKFTHARFSPTVPIVDDVQFIPIQWIHHQRYAKTTSIPSTVKLRQDICTLRLPTTTLRLLTPSNPPTVALTTCFSFLNASSPPNTVAPPAHAPLRYRSLLPREAASAYFASLRAGRCIRRGRRASNCGRTRCGRRRLGGS